MKSILLLTFAISSTAMATTVLSWDAATDQVSLATEVNSGPTYATDSGAFSGTFTILFTGLGSIYPPGDPDPAFFLTIPIDFSFNTDGIPYDDSGSACLVGAICSTSDGSGGYLRD